MAAAADLFSHRPYAEVSIDDIAQQAGVAHGLISYYFRGKSGLFSAAITEISTELLLLQTPRPEELTQTEKLRGSLRRHFQYVRENPDRYRLLMPSTHPDSSIHAELAAERARIIEASLDCPQNPPLVLRASLQAWGGFVEQITQFWLADTRMVVDDVVDLCLHNLAGVVLVASGLRHDLPSTLASLSASSGAPGAQR